MRGLGKRAAGIEVFADGRIVPVGEVGDEVEQRTAQFLVVVQSLWSVLEGNEPWIAFLTELSEVFLRPSTHALPCGLTEGFRAESIDGIGPECRANYCPTG